MCVYVCVCTFVCACASKLVFIYANLCVCRPMFACVIKYLRVSTCMCVCVCARLCDKGPGVSRWAVPPPTGLPPSQGLSPTRQRQEL